MTIKCAKFDRIAHRKANRPCHKMKCMPKDLVGYAVLDCYISMRCLH